MRTGEVARAAGVEVETLHVTNGDSAGGTLRQTSIEGFVVAWRDMLPEGPLARLPAAELRRLRARFLAGCGWGELAAIEAGLEQRDRALADALAAGHHIVLWFEQDVLDQLQLLQVLAAVGDAQRVELTLLDRPGVKGLGELEPAALEALWPERVPLTPAIADVAARAWDAVCAPDPTALASLLESDTSALPLLAAALARWLQELPDTAGGLALSERRVLESLARARKTRHELFLESMDGERLLLNGDTWFFRRLDELGALVAPDGARLAITDAGRRVLAGELDRVEHVGLDRWLGGTHLTAENAWRRDGKRLVAP